jgi:hypothetical protein
LLGRRLTPRVTPTPAAPRSHAPGPTLVCTGAGFLELNQARAAAAPRNCPSRLPPEDGAGADPDQFRELHAGQLETPAQRTDGSGRDLRATGGTGTGPGAVGGQSIGQAMHAPLDSGKGAFVAA